MSMLTHASRLAQLRDLEAGRYRQSRLLVVRHGPGRGPRIRLRAVRPARCQPMFDDIARRFPNLGRCFDYWYTGTPLPDIADVQAVIFLLQDPLRECYPDCFDDASRLASIARAAGTRIINAPEALSNTIKSTQSRLWRDAGIPTPPCTGFTTVSELLEMADKIEFPILIKADTMHAQNRMLICQNADELIRMDPAEIPTPGAVSPFIDTRRGYQDIDPQSPYATHYHKKRAMVFGDHVCNNHVFFADQPIVGCVSSTFGHFCSWNPIQRTVLNNRYKTHIECDLAYSRSEPEKPDVLARAAAVLGVELSAIDYSTMANGEIVLWEANPFYSLHRWPYAVLGRKRSLNHRMPHIHDTAAIFFRELVEGAA